MDVLDQVRKTVRGPELDSELEATEDVQQGTKQEDDFERDGAIDPWQFLREGSIDSRGSDEIGSIQSETFGDVGADDDAEGALASADGDEALPEDWEKIWDENHQAHYYWNSCTGESTWEFPE